MNRKVYSADVLEKYILMFIKDGINYPTLVKEYGLSIHNTIFYQYVNKYRKYGLEALKPRKLNNIYSEEFKQKVVNAYLNGEGSLRDLTLRFNIPAVSTVSYWIMKYTEGKSSKSYSTKPEVYTMKMSKTTTSERIEIVKDCLSNNLSYVQTAKKYQVSYNNVYSWVQKYKKHGSEGLIDGRGRRKPSKIQTETEQLRTEIAALEAKNEYLKTENAVLKKLEEIERGSILKEHDMKRNFKPSPVSKKKDSK